VRVNIEIMHAFVRFPQVLASHEDLARKIVALERKYDTQFTLPWARTEIAPPNSSESGESSRLRRTRSEGTPPCYLLRTTNVTWKSLAAMPPPQNGSEPVPRGDRSRRHVSSQTANRRSPSTRPALRDFAGSGMRSGRGSADESRALRPDSRNCWSMTASIHTHKELLHSGHPADFQHHRKCSPHP